MVTRQPSQDVAMSQYIDGCPDESVGSRKTDNEEKESQSKETPSCQLAEVRRNVWPK